jgi:AcrR family transcriptional regulator
MSTPTSPPLPKDARDYTGDDWLRYGESATPSVRQKLVALTIEEVIRSGPADFSTKTVCDRIGAKYPIINYYFGSRDGLLAEASAVTYRKSMLAMRDCIAAAPNDAEKRFRAYIQRELDWYQELSAWGILINYPIASKVAGEILETKYGDELARYFEFYLSMVGTMVQDLRRGTVSSFDFGVDNYPRASLLAHPKIALDTISIVWSVHGIAVWSSGNQVGSRLTSGPSLTQKMAIKHHIDHLVERATTG